MKGIRILMLIVLVAQVYCSTEKRGKIKMISQSGTFGDVNKKSYEIYLNDKNICIVKRSYDYCYKWVFRYQSVIENDKILLNSLMLDGANSKFLFSSRCDLGHCEADYGKEHSYNSLRCIPFEISNIKTDIEHFTEMICREKEYEGIECRAEYKNAYINSKEMDLDVINYIIYNMSLDTYPVTNEFNMTAPYKSYRVKNNKMITLNYYTNKFQCLFDEITITNKGNYSDVLISSYFGKMTFLCLESDCKCICMVSDYQNEWSFICFKSGSDFDIEFNNAYNVVYNNAKNYNPSNKIGLESTLDEEVRKETKATNGYYNEDVKEGENGYYKGYFVVDNTLTIIEQSSGWSQRQVEQFKLVLKLDSKTKSVKLMSINDEIVDKENSGVEPEYDDGYSDELCKSFIPLKDDGKYTTCKVVIEDLVNEYINKEYNIAESGSDSKLIIHDLSDNTDKTIPLAEYEDSTKLNGIINRITKNTKPIPNDKCLIFNITDYYGNRDITFYNEVSYTNFYSNTSLMKAVGLFFYQNENHYYYTYDKINSCYLTTADVYNNQYIVNSKSPPFYHSYVALQIYNYEGCNENMKNNVIEVFENRIKKVKEEEEISDRWSDDGIETITTNNDDTITTTASDDTITTTTNDNTITTTIDDNSAVTTPDDDNSTTVDNNDDNTSNIGRLYTLNMLLFSLIFILFM